MDMVPHRLPNGMVAMELVFASPEEMQEYLHWLTPDVPEGHHYVTKRGSRNGRPSLIHGVTQIGKPLVLESEQTGADDVVKPKPPPTAIEIPKGVRDATPEALEMMAVRNGVEVNEHWKKQPMVFRQASVAKAMKGKRELANAGK